MEPIRICLIDDHEIVRQGLKELIKRLGDYEVSHEFDDGDHFLESLPLDPQPDMYILDYSMPHKNGIEVLQELEKMSGEYKVMLLTQHIDEHIIDDAYHHGARGFLHKNCTAGDLKLAIDNILNIGYDNISEILKRVKNYDNRDLELTPSAFDLSDKELEFLSLVCDDRELTYDQMAKLMKVSIKSIDAYRSALFDRFQIKSKVGLVLFSYKYRLTEPFL
ncbi:MAG: hypothetical protein RL607_82 [Bacteroidota bacterium]|jgi:DNA-binding NarL/FixJ family response regulator